MTAKKGFKIEKMYAFITKDENGEEGIMAELIGDKWMPFVGGDWMRVKDLKKIAQVVTKESGKEIKIVEFSQRKVIEVIK